MMKWTATTLATIAVAAVLGSASRTAGLAAETASARPGAQQDPAQHESHPGDDEHHQHHLHGEPAAPAASERALEPRIPDPVLVDQHGERHRFYSDLVKGKLVLMNSIYTTCPGTCPVQTAIFSQVQRKLGERAGSEVQMLSVSLDPVTDTPERLKEFAERFEARPGWLFLTGPKQDVTDVLQAMDLYSPDPAQHTPMAAIGHEPAGLWMKVINLNAPTDIVGRLDRVKALGDERLGRQ
jgi:protein SCO1/2